MYKSFEQYIDTDILGLIVTLDHNLGTVPLVGFSKLDSLGKQTHVSLYDPIFVEVESININQIKVTFSGAFKGFFRAIVGDAKDLEARILNLEGTVSTIYDQIKLKISKNQCQQIQNYRDQQLQEINQRLTDLTTVTDTLRQKVDNL